MSLKYRETMTEKWSQLVDITMQLCRYVVLSKMKARGFLKIMLQLFNLDKRNS